MTNARDIIADRMSDLNGSKDSWEADAESVIAALTAAGLVIVPKEPTEKMWSAGHAEMFNSVNTIWRAMVEAASDE